MLKLTQKSYKTDDGKLVAYVETCINIDNYSYNVKFDEKTKKRFNTFARKNGFVVGVVDKEPTPHTKEVY